MNMNYQSSSSGMPQMAVTNDPNDRKFSLENIAPGVTIDEAHVYRRKHCQLTWFQHGPCDDGNFTGQPDPLIIAVGGACKNNGLVDARAAAGVFVGQNSEHNDSILLDDDEATNQKAELEAGILGLQKADLIERRGTDGQPLKLVIVKSKLQYLVEGMTEYMTKWKRNGFRDARNKIVTNAPLFKAMDDLVLDLNKVNVQVKFWHVSREHNEDANRLAKLPLEGAALVAPSSYNDI